MAGLPAILLRLWRLHACPNPLARYSDRVESALVISAVFLALTGIAVAAAVGSDTAAGGIERSHREMTTRHPSVAVTLLEVSHPAFPIRVKPRHGREQEALASWVTPDGARHLGNVCVRQGTAVGATVPIWVDPAGNYVTAPFRSVAAISLGVEAGLLTWLGILALSTAPCWLARIVLNRLRYTQWAREWKHIGPDSN